MSIKIGDTLYEAEARVVDLIHALERDNATLTAELATVRHALQTNDEDTNRLQSENETLAAERDALAAAIPSEGADAALAYAAMKTERDALRAKIDGSYVQNCIIEPRPGDGPLFNGDGYCARLHGYAIVDREKYEAMRAELEKLKERNNG